MSLIVIQVIVLHFKHSTNAEFMEDDYTVFAHVDRSLKKNFVVQFRLVASKQTREIN